MDVSFDCDNCGQNIVIDAAGAGLTVQCPKCNQSVVVPVLDVAISPPSAPVSAKKGIRFSCDKCGQHLTFDEDGAGETVQCPTCSQTLVVPTRDVVTSPPRAPDRGEVQTNVKQGAASGGGICFLLGIAISLLLNGIAASSTRPSVGEFLGLTSLTLYICGPLFLASLILSIVAMAQGRTASGVLLLLTNLIGAPFAILIAPLFFSYAVANKFDRIQSTTQAAQPSEADMAVPSLAKTPIHESKYPALDEKNGFRDYRFGTTADQIMGIGPLGESAPGVERKVPLENFDKRLGDFEISGITLIFDGGLLKEINVRTVGKQNIEGLKQTLIAAYGQPEKELFGDDLAWDGVKVRLCLWLHSFGTESATAHFASKEVEAQIKAAIDQRAREGATTAKKGL